MCDTLLNKQIISHISNHLTFHSMIQYISPCTIISRAFDLVKNYIFLQKIEQLFVKSVLYTYDIFFYYSCDLVMN